MKLPLRADAGRVPVVDVISAKQDCGACIERAFRMSDRDGHQPSKALAFTTSSSHSNPTPGTSGMWRRLSLIS